MDRRLPTHSSLIFNTSKNEAEYEAFLVGLRLAGKFEAENVVEMMDLMLELNQINRDLETKDRWMENM